SSLTICALILAIERYPFGAMAGLIPGHSRPDAVTTRPGALANWYCRRVTVDICENACAVAAWPAGQARAVIPRSVPSTGLSSHPCGRAVQYPRRSFGRPRG